MTGNIVPIDKDAKDTIIEGITRQKSSKESLESFMEARLVDAGPIKSAVEFLLGTAEDGNSDCVQVLAKLIANNHLLPSITCPFQTPKGRELRVFLQGRGGAGIQAFLEKLN